MVQLSSSFFVTIIFSFLSNLSVNASSSSEARQYVSKDEETRLKFGKLLNAIANVNKQRLNGLMTYNKLDKHRLVDGVLRLKDERDPMVAVMFLNKNNPVSNKLYEIYDNDLKNAPGDTPVRDILQQIQNYYEYNDEKTKNRNILGKLNPYYHIQREKENVEDNDGEDIIPVNNNNKVKDKSNNIIQDETSDGEELGSKSGMNNNVQPDKAITKLKLNAKENLNANKETSNKQILRIFKSCTRKAIKVCKKACTAAAREICKSFKCSKSMKKTFKKHCGIECKERFGGNEN